MSSHADTIRRSFLPGAMHDKPRAALDALLAGKQRLREALERIAEETETICPGPNHDYEAVPTNGAKIAREALAGDAE